MFMFSDIYNQVIYIKVHDAFSCYVGENSQM